MFESAFELSPVLQAILDDSGRVVRANAQFRAAFGGDVLDRNIDDVVCPVSHGLMSLVRSLVSGSQSFSVQDVVIRLPEGREMTVEARGAPLPNSGALLALVDYTQRVTEATARAQRERSETIARFAGGLAHDLNNLLAAIMATAQAGMADVEEGGGDPRGDLSAIMEEAERGAALARSLRAIAFDETGSWRPVDLRAEVRAAAAVLGRGSDSVPIVLLVDDSTPEIVGDRARLHQLVLNLLINARDATRSYSGGIEVSLAPTEDNGAELTVSDSGPGVPTPLRERIFQPYFSTKRRTRDGSETGSSWGTGLGLAIVDAVARSTGATVSVGDRAGGGAEFKVRWPPTSVNRDLPELARAVSGPFSPALVLLADNEAALVGAVARQLRRMGHSVYAAMSAAECCRLFEQYVDSIDVVVLDVKLGDGDGRELAQQFRSQRPDLGIVLISASGSVLGAAQPPARALAKPFDVKDLTSAIELARQDAMETHA